MEGAGLNYKKLVTAMSVMTLAAVYTAACIALPRLVKNPGQGIRTPKDLFNRDFKKFSVGDVVIGVGQVNCMEQEEVQNIKVKMKDYISTVTGDNGMDMVFFMITNVLDGGSEVLCSGKNASATISQAFNVGTTDDSVYLDGVVSRKKQMLPAIMEALQQ